MTNRCAGMVCVCVCVFLKPAVLSHEWFLMKLNRYITQCLSSWVPHDVSSQGESFRFKSAVRTSVHYVSFPDVAICSLTIPWMFWNYLKAIGSNGKKRVSAAHTHTVTELENQYMLHSRYAMESSLPHYGWYFLQKSSCFSRIMPVSRLVTDHWKPIYTTSCNFYF